MKSSLLQPASTGSSNETVLVCDLDGTLCLTDTLHEALLGLITVAPASVLSLPGWLARGRAGFKAAIAKEYVVPGEALPMNPEVIDRLAAARAEGRRTALVSAADQRQVDAVSKATDLFDEAFGSDGIRNLKGAEKAAFLTERYGEKGFDYIGDAQTDLPVWKAARRAVVVGDRCGVLSSARDVNTQTDHIPRHSETRRALLRALRPHQWSKNILLFLPMFAAHDISALPMVILGFLAFCLTASVVYVVNDLLDLAADRAHPRKRLRPFASGSLSATDGLCLMIALSVSALLLTFVLGSPLFAIVLGLYFVTTFAYSLWLKRRLLADILTLAGLYTIRVIAGAAAASVSLSPWMLGFSLFLFLALAAVKRQTELMDLLISGRSGLGRVYEVDDLPVLRGIALSSSHAAVLVLALYISSNDVQTLYDRPELLWLVCPLLLYWALRMVVKAHRGQMTDDPIVFSLTDRTSLIVVVFAVLLVVSAAG